MQEVFIGLIGVFVGYFLKEISRMINEKAEAGKILKIIKEELELISSNVKDQHSTLFTVGQELLNKKSASLCIEVDELKKIIEIYQKFQMINKGLERHAILDSAGMPSKEDLKNKILKWREECFNDIEKYTKNQANSV
jgi:hypothetical protein